MADVKDYGIVYTSDILVIGGGFAGLVTAIKAKQTDPDLDILVVDKGTIGWTGQATKAGNGIRSTVKGGLKPLMRAMNYQVTAHTEYLNDQEFLMQYLDVHKDNIDYLNKLGVKTSFHEDGSVMYADLIVPGGYEMSAIEINSTRSLRNFALKCGIRLLSRVNIFELLTAEDGSVIGGIGFDMDDAVCHIFHAKAVAMATQGCHFKKIGLEFMGYGTGVGAAYRVGAIMRNTEFSTQTDIVFKKNNTPIYGGFNIIKNRLGENIKDKYCGPEPIFEVDSRLVLGMVEEVRQGNGPIWCDLEHPDFMRAMFGGVRPEEEQAHTPDKMNWEHHVMEKTARACGEVGLRPETTIKMVLQVEPVKVDIHYATDVSGLWAPGKICGQGCSYFGWTRGDGVGKAATAGMLCGEDMAKYVSGRAFEPLNLRQVAELKEKIYAPLHRNTTHKPKEIFDWIESYIFDVKKLIIKSEDSIRGILAEIEEMYKLVPELTADDAHSLAKCLEAADNILCCEMAFRAALERKESRGQMYPHYRTDYPERDDKNWLKWVNLKQGKDGRMEVFTEEIPIWRYPLRPEGYEIPDGHEEEFYVPDNPLAAEIMQVQKELAAERQQY